MGRRRRDGAGRGRLGRRARRRGARCPAATRNRHDLGGRGLGARAVGRAPDQYPDAHSKQQCPDAGDERAVDRCAGSRGRAVRIGRLSGSGVLRRAVRRWHARRSAALPALQAVALVGRHRGAARGALVAAGRGDHRRAELCRRHIRRRGHVLSRLHVRRSPLARGFEFSGASARSHSFGRTKAAAAKTDQGGSVPNDASTRVGARAPASCEQPVTGIAIGASAGDRREHREQRDRGAHRARHATTESSPRVSRAGVRLAFRWPPLRRWPVLRHSARAPIRSGSCAVRSAARGSRTTSATAWSAGSDAARWRPRSPS